ncbi:hypothetical protein BDW42DRAFT_159787 [Aspergillus taichungensis]|uniref:Uncharacterized protein n=1 Tax=Aspergillus taichungensis TaxID=482145 RepID=A0A2J5I7K0_9EURO|nr:hypothetical protein BDW42DRAFT_159787 [Aspergillus taichungensis]
MWIFHQSIYIRRWNSEIGQIAKDEVHIFGLNSLHHISAIYFLAFFLFCSYYTLLILMSSCFLLHFLLLCFY